LKEIFSVPFKDHPEYDNQQANKEHEDGNPVDRIHITDPTARRLIGIPFPDIQVFCQLT
jgi:hypothetical protein